MTNRHRTRRHGKPTEEVGVDRMNRADGFYPGVT